MRHKLAAWLRRLADRLSPEPPNYIGLPQAVIDLLPRANEIVASLESNPGKGPTRWLIALKQFRKERPGVPDRYLNLAINRALVGLRGD